VASRKGLKDYNFTDVLHAVEDLDVFGLEKDIKHAKVDAFKQTFETNFKKSSADIISSVKAYSSLGMYSTSSVPDNILFNSNFQHSMEKVYHLFPIL
jgi:hypothetical protein